MKKETAKLFQDFPDLLIMLEDLRKNKQLSYNEIATFYSERGYKCSRKLIERLIKKYIGSIPRSKEGKNNPFYGKVHTEETKRLISTVRIKKGIAKGINNPMYGMSGKLSPAWKGGASSKQALFYASNEWQVKRLEIMNRDGFVCKQCGFSASSSHNSLNVHHIIPLSISWAKRLNDKNLITLCVSCHEKTFGKELEFVAMFEDIVRTA